MKHIQTLPLMVANQIAAGEVIERPASVVKELFENALDSGASRITIDIGFGGLNKIIISDNGSGIYEEDLPLAIAPHATSKIHILDDLDTLTSMGFRGEALASIASVARLQIVSKTADAPHATLLECRDGQVRLSPSAREQGTTVEILDLFYNAPVRKKFLKSERTEFLAIESLVRRLAMSAPHVQVTLIHNGKQQYTLPHAHDHHSLLKRARHMLGKKFAEAALLIEAEYEGMLLRGWVGASQYQRSQHDGYWVYLNQRFIKDKLLNHAIKKAYQPWLAPGRYPVCLLYLTLKPHTVDVNVHPTKHEVRFQNARLVHDFLVSEIQRVLMLSERGGELTEPSDRTPPAEGALTQNQLSGSVSSITQTATPYLPPSSSTLFSPREEASKCFSLLKKGNGSEKVRVGGILTLAQPQLSGSLHSIVSAVTQHLPINHQFGVLACKQQLYLVDWQRLRYHWYLDILTNKPTPWPNRSLLVPISVVCHRIDDIGFDILACLLEALGLQISRHDQALGVETVPLQFPQLAITTFFDAIFALTTPTMEALIQIIARQAAAHPEWMIEDAQRGFDAYWNSHWDILCSYSGVARVLTVDICRTLLHE